MYLIVATVVIIVIYVLISRRFNAYWPNRGIYQLKRSKGLFKAITNIINNKTQSFFEMGQEMYKDIQDKKLGFGGTYVFSGQTFIPIDAELVKNIFIKDFDYFMDHGFFHNEKVDPLSGHLFNLEGARWKKMRQNLTPTFTSGKIKMMFETMVVCTQELKTMLAEYADKKEPVPIVDSLARLTTDIIANVAFGIECNSIKNPNAEFREQGRIAFTPSKWAPFKLLILPLLPQSVVQFLGIKMSKPETENFFLGVVKTNAEYREKNNVVRKDFFQLLLQLKNEGKINDTGDLLNNDLGESKMTIEEVAAQCFLFFVAGFDTSSNVMAFTLYELANNQELQKKLRESINKVLEKHNDEATYDAINEMDYLHMVVSETMRKYPVLGIIPRVCTKDYKVPDSKITIEKGTTVWIPVSGLHRDPQYYPNPEKYDPERFNPENIKSINGKCVYLPFGEGPRQCIGLRFGLLQSKVGLVMILRNFEFSLNIKSQGPLEYRAMQFITTPKTDIYLDLKKIEKFSNTLSLKI